MQFISICAHQSIEIFKRFLHVGCEHLSHRIAGNTVGNIEVQNGILHNLQSTATLCLRI